MRTRSSREVLALGTAMVLMVGAAGCSRKAVEAPPVPAAPPVAASQGDGAPPPATPSTPEAAAAELVPAYFSYDSYRLGQTAREALDRNAMILRERSGARITIEGHCDERGTAEYNQALGEQRARAARDYLIAAGIGPDRIEIVSYGKERPFDEGHDEAAWAANRRAHLVTR